MSVAEDFARASAQDELDGPGSSGQRPRPSVELTGDLDGSGDRASDPDSEGSSPDLRPGDFVADRYLVEKVIGCGGHGAIHRARHLDLDLPVAVKVLHLGRPNGPQRELVQRFLREAKIAASIRHRNVLSVHDTGRLADGSPFIVMELIEGDDLERRLARGPMTIPAIVDLGRQLFSGLTAIADAGVLHRDVKPANVMLHRETDGLVLMKLIDFGIARSPAELERLTMTGAVVGTPHYMSPEQLRGETLDVRADMYAASAVLYEALTGRPPFDGDATALVIGQILSAAFRPIRELRPDCPEALAQIVEHGLARRRADRRSHPMRVVSALDEVARTERLPTGALAWAGDVGLSLTQPIALERRRLHTPTRPGADEPPDVPVLPTPAEDPKPAEQPERPNEIEDLPPEIPPRRARGRALAIGTAVLLTAVVASLATRGPDPIAAEPPPPSRPVVTATPSSLPAPPEVDRLLDEGLEALARGEVDAALAHYRAALRIDPDRAEAQRGRGVAAARAGLHDEAIAAFERYLALSPDASDGERVRERIATLRAARSARLTQTSTQPARRPRAHPHR